MQHKTCSVCRQEKLLPEFAASKATRDGRANRCRPCNKEYMAAWRAANPGNFMEWKEKNSERRSAYEIEWREKNRGRRAAYMADWLKANSASVNARIAKRGAAKVRATPDWADQRAMEQFYLRAAELTKLTGVRHEVDHFYPLQGEKVCGLHCEANLRVITKTENISKHNRMPEEWTGVKATQWAAT